MRLCILIFCFFHGTCWTSDHRCVHQPKTLYVKEGGDSVTIPCTYTYPEHLREKIRVIWQEAEAKRFYCITTNKTIIDSSGNITDEYRDRISVVNDLHSRMASITIRGLNASDEIAFCCKVTIFPPGKDDIPYYDVFGTSPYFADGQLVTQLEELIALPGEDVIIPCRYPLETLGEALQVTWYRGSTYFCEFIYDNIYTWTSAHRYSRFSLVNFPEDVSLRIHTLQRIEYSYYCCSVTTRDGTIRNSKLATRLTIIGSRSFSSPFNVTQTQYIAGLIGESVMLKCSFSPYNESDVVSVNTYWRLGNISGPYVYHPYKEMVHPSYRGRTEITGPADLHIRGLQMSDDSTYYCFVMIQLCVGRYLYDELFHHGVGTRLIVSEPNKQRLGLIVSITVVVLLGLLCCFVILKKKGVICE